MGHSELSFSGAEKKSPAETEYGQLMKGLQGTILMSLRIGLVAKEISVGAVPNLLLRLAAALKLLLFWTRW